MHEYPTTRAQKFLTLPQLIDDLYGYDCNLYSLLKKNEGQYAYFAYINKVQRAIKNVFYKPLPGETHCIASTIDSPLVPRSSETCIILNNNSLLAHVTVLRSIGSLLNKYSRKGKVKIISLTNSPLAKV